MAIKKHPIVIHIDDDRDDRELVHEMIMQIDRSLEVISLCCGEESIDKLEQLKQEHKLPCLMIVDMNMPKMTGADLTRFVKEDEVLKNVPVILFTTSDVLRDSSVLDGSLVSYMTKPINLRAMEDCVKKMLRQCVY